MSEPILGEIKMFAGNFAPRGYALCEGQLLPIGSNQALFSLLGTTYGGDGETTFALPDLRGRVPLQSGNGPGLSPRPLGQKSGTESVTLTTAQLPAHSHTAEQRALDGPGNSKNPNGRIPAELVRETAYSDAMSDATLTPGSIAVANTGNNEAHTNMQPYLSINFIIALTGVFPSEN